ncbi:hypothetical protein [Chroococcidiopsis sp. CCALA 051]|nr:hypothetical protein [Chroococcidiopsis sp. CCALA 051]
MTYRTGKSEVGRQGRQGRQGRKKFTISTPYTLHPTPYTPHPTSH